jgi:hypothetical protein
VITRRQGVPLFTAIGALIFTLVVIQLWLVSAALDALLAGERSVLWPAAAASGAIALANGGLVLYALGYDRRLRRISRHA